MPGELSENSLQNLLYSSFWDVVERMWHCNSPTDFSCYCSCQRVSDIPSVTLLASSRYLAIVRISRRGRAGGAKKGPWALTHFRSSWWRYWRCVSLQLGLPSFTCLEARSSQNARQRGRREYVTTMQRFLRYLVLPELISPQCNDCRVALHFLLITKGVAAEVFLHCHRIFKRLCEYKSSYVFRVK